MNNGSEVERLEVQSFYTSSLHQQSFKFIFPKIYLLTPTSMLSDSSRVALPDSPCKVILLILAIYVDPSGHLLH